MQLTLSFFLNAVLLGVGLSMDAFSVSLANGLAEPEMQKKKSLSIAATFSFFQALMPLLGWLCVHAAVRSFSAVQPFVPWAALLLLCAIGIHMILTARRPQTQEDKGAVLSPGALLVQGIATSIDALSVGFTIADYDAKAALVCALLIAAVTFAVCLGGVALGKRFGVRLAGRASILGGVILICIGVEIWLKGIL